MGAMPTALRGHVFLGPVLSCPRQAVGMAPAFACRQGEFMQRALIWVDDLLRGPRAAAPGVSLGRCVALVAGGGMLYGAVMGSFGGWDDGRVWQAVFAALKVPLLLLATFALTLP